jgi:hypothetical protein
MAPSRLVPILIAAASLVSASSAQAQQWRLQQELEIGKSGTPVITQVGGILVARDGTMFVLQPQDNEVAVFGPDGSAKASLGRPGDGPGEFRALSQAGWLGDTLWVSDARLRRITYLSSSGQLLGTRSVTGGQASSLHLPAMPQVIARGGQNGLATATASADHIESGRVRYLPLLLFNLADGSIVAEAGRIATANRMIALRYPNGGGMFGPQPFSDGPLAAPLRDGSGFVVVDRSAATRAGRNAYHVTLLSALGDTIWRRSFDYAARSMDSSIVDERRSGFVTFLARRLGNEQQAARQVSEALFVPRFAPPVTALVAGRDGTIWLRREEHRTSVTWDVLGPNGRRLGSVTARPDLQIMEADLGSVWGDVRDALDVPSVVRYRLIR